MPEQDLDFRRNAVCTQIKALHTYLHIWWLSASFNEHWITLTERPLDYYRLLRNSVETGCLTILEGFS